MAGYVVDRRWRSLDGAWMAYCDSSGWSWCSCSDAEWEAFQRRQDRRSNARRRKRRAELERRRIRATRQTV